MELRYERAFTTLGAIRYEGVRHGDSRMYWYFNLTNPVDLEDHMFMTRPAVEITKMALARRLQIIDGTDDETRARRWELTKDAPIALLTVYGEGHAHDDAEGHDDAAGGDVAVRGGRGRGRARGRGVVAADGGGGDGKGRGRGRGRARGRGDDAHVRGGRGRGRRGGGGRG